MNFYKSILVFIVLLFTEIIFAQVIDPKELFPVKPLPKVDSRDVMWHRRLWREIDLTEKINQHLYFGDSKANRSYCLYDILDAYIHKGAIKAYSPKNDEFDKELTIQEVNNKLGDSILIDGKLIYKELESRNVVKFWLKEDWFFDAKYSKIEVRITGVCPIKVKKDKDGNIMGYEQLYWLYFPNIRGVLVNYEAFKKQEENDPRISFDDVFTFDRKFNSYVVIKAGNKLRELKQTKTELDVKLENEKTKVYHFNKQTQLWNN
jgi:gliding motility associated protien GldN